MKKVILFLFAGYWLITMLFVSPENFMRVKASDFLLGFGSLFQQKWAFFAPPPQGNQRLYYSYYDVDNKIIGTYEVLEPLLAEKQKKAPLNTREEAIDYIVNGSIGNLIDYIIAQREIYEQIYPDSTHASLEKKAKDEISRKYRDIPAFMTLVNYGKIVAEKNLSKHDFDKTNNFVIAITEIKLPKFADREKLLSDSTKAEGLVMLTPKINFNK